MVVGEAVATERVYQSLRARILEGHYALGERIDLRMIADHYRTSVTPVRDAVHRLLGEQLVEVHARGGVQVPLFTRERLIALYSWNAILAQTACPAHLGTPRMDVPINYRSALDSPIADSSLAATFFLSLSAALGHGLHQAAVAQANDFLHAARIAEVATIPDAAEEIIELSRLWSIKSNGFLRKLQKYHARRIALASIITSEIHALHGI